MPATQKLTSRERRNKIKVSAINKANGIKETLYLTEEQQRVQEVALAYEDALSVYWGKPALRYIKGLVKFGSTEYTQFLRIIEFAAELGVDYKTYYRALFYYSNKWGNRAPKLWECSSFKSKVPAKDRVSMYLIEVKEVRAVVGPTRQAPAIPQSIKDRQSEMQMKAFVKNYNISEEEVFLRFAQGRNATLFFDSKWLKHNQTYLRLRESGEI